MVPHEGCDGQYPLRSSSDGCDIDILCTVRDAPGETEKNSRCRVSVGGAMWAQEFILGVLDMPEYILLSWCLRLGLKRPFQKVDFSYHPL